MPEIANNARALLLIVLFSLNSVCLSDSQAPTNPIPGDSNLSEMGEMTDGRVKEKPQIKKHSDGKYHVGSIKIDKAKRLITIPGKMLSYEAGKPIEFLATMRNGYKSYESIFMLDVNAFEFNLACILIGLDSSNAVPPKFHFDPEPVKGDQVSIRISWENNGKMFEYDIIQLLRIGNANTNTIPSDWSYTGSMFVGDDQYLAQMDGVLIGLIHDPASIIEHRTGLGLSNYGMLTINTSIAPKKGQEILITIQAHK